VLVFATLVVAPRDKDLLEVGLGFEVDDLEAACDLVTANGGTIVDPPKQRQDEGIRRADVTDPAGNRVSVASR